ncbi:hypothetical protein CY35_18G063100 [Sphagnum magellanicum]|nr:hypothetical protein CY35_18G063100 [Sphagnum magellanicum]
MQSKTSQMGKLAKPRQLHNSHWGTMCLAETLEGQALESSRISQCFGIREPRQGKGIALKLGHCGHFLLWHQLVVEV